MHIGILGGTGPLGRGLAVRLAAAGHQVAIGSRDAARATAVCEELRGAWPDRSLALAGMGNAAAVAAGAGTVVLATPWEAALGTVADLGEDLAGATVVSVGNALVRQGREAHALVPPRGSVAAMVQAALPASAVVAAGHHLPARSLADLDHDLRSDVLVCSDHPEAATAVVSLLDSVPGLRGVAAGSLAQAAAIEAFTAVLVTVNMTHRVHSTLQLAGLSAWA
ncbi:MAG: NADPH-dependent F420 reductase [Actinomycetota bacterium]|nr:NADPH-dependent F420 reductase [Actinomycetota bacterium]